jgi:hypothetical protein
VAFVGAALSSLFGTLSSWFAPAATTGAAAAGAGAAAAGAGAAAAGAGAAAAGAGAATGAAASSSGFLGLGSGFWTALGVGFTALSTINTINSNNQMARAAIFDTAMQKEAAEIDYARRRSDIRRETDREIARRTSLLSATGGLVDGADLVLEGLLEGARAESRLATDLGFEMGALTTRAANIRAGTRRANVGALLEGGARIASLLSR